MLFRRCGAGFAQPGGQHYFRKTVSGLFYSNAKTPQDHPVTTVV